MTKKAIIALRLTIGLIVVCCVIIACKTIPWGPEPAPVVDAGAQRELTRWADDLGYRNLTRFANDLLLAGGQNLEIRRDDQIWQTQAIADIYRERLQSAGSASFFVFLREARDRNLLNRLLSSRKPGREDAIAFKKALAEIAGNIVQTSISYAELQPPLDGLVYRSLVLRIAEYPRRFDLGAVLDGTPFLTQADVNNAQIIAAFIEDIRHSSGANVELRNVFQGIHAEDYLQAARIIVERDILYRNIVDHPTFEKLKEAMKSMDLLL